MPTKSSLPLSFFKTAVKDNRFNTGTDKFPSHHEKQMRSPAIKAVEHFVPLFVGTFSAAPYRLEFSKG